MGTKERRRRRRRRPSGGCSRSYVPLYVLDHIQEGIDMTRTYPVGWSVELKVTRTAAGPTARVSLTPSAWDDPEVIGGLLSYECLADLERFVFALISDLSADPF